MRHVFTAANTVPRRVEPWRYAASFPNCDRSLQSCRPPKPLSPRSRGVSQKPAPSPSFSDLVGMNHAADKKKLGSSVVARWYVSAASHTKARNMRYLAAALIILLAGPAVGQQHHHEEAPYTGQHQREIKALSEQQLEDLRAGRGMGFALSPKSTATPVRCTCWSLLLALGCQPTRPSASKSSTTR